MGVSGQLLARARSRVESSLQRREVEGVRATRKYFPVILHASATSALQLMAMAVCTAVLDVAGHDDPHLGETKRVHTARGFHMFAT
jgi:hypothetical protein